MTGATAPEFTADGRQVPAALIGELNAAKPLTEDWHIR